MKLKILQSALHFKGASLVIYRAKMRVEFQTENLHQFDYVTESGAQALQIGHSDDHHCQLDIEAIDSIHFVAEPYVLQGNRLSYTLWFLTSGACENPLFRDGSFSVVFNKGHEGIESRTEIIEQIFHLYERCQHLHYVSADRQFQKMFSIFKAREQLLAQSTFSLSQGDA